MGFGAKPQGLSIKYITYSVISIKSSSEITGIPSSAAFLFLDDADILSLFIR